MNNTQYYYASSNSMSGFQNYFDKIYDPEKLLKLYIIKGTPGSGKSTMIKRIAEEFENTEKCIRFLCSSDPNSLDGLIINDKIAIVDGTSPHSVEAKFPCAVDKIVDNAKGVDPKISHEAKWIKELTNKKKKLFAGVYSYLRSCGVIKSERLNALRSTVDDDKLNSAVDRYFRQSLKKGDAYGETIRLTEGITPLGTVRTRAFESISASVAVMVNSKGCEEILYQAFISKLKEYRVKTYVSYDPLIPYSVNGIYLPDSSFCAVNYHEEDHGFIDYDKYKVFNFERFTNAKQVSSMRAKLRFSAKCETELLNEAIRYLSEAAQVHKELESIYARYMDFSIVDENTYNIINEIGDLI